MIVLFIVAALVMFFCGCFWAFWATITITKWVAIGFLILVAIKLILEEFF